MALPQKVIGIWLEPFRHLEVGIIVIGPRPKHVPEFSELLFPQLAKAPVRGVLEAGVTQSPRVTEVD